MTIAAKHQKENENMTSPTEAQFLAEQHERAVAYIEAVTEKTGNGPTEFNAADAQRLDIALATIPMAGMPDPRVVVTMKSANVEDLAFFLLNYGAAYGEALRERDRLATKVADLENEKAAFRRFIGTE